MDFTKKEFAAIFSALIGKISGYEESYSFFVDIDYYGLSLIDYHNTLIKLKKFVRKKNIKLPPQIENEIKNL